MTAHDRRLAWDACLNVRDLGGLRGGDRLTKRGVLVRASALGDLRPAGADAIRAHGVRTVVDIRWPHEVASLASPFALGATYRNVPVDAGMKLDLHGHAVAGTLGALLPQLAEPGSGIAAAVEAVAAGEPAVVVHCQAGRDRTGVVVALMLAAIGVADVEIVDDYCASDDELVGEYARFLTTQPDARAGLAATIGKRAWVMRELLRAIRADYGDAGAYLRAAGVAPGTIDRLRGALFA